MIVVDTIALPDGSIAHSHRFRSTGSGASIFHPFGRWMRQTRIDELPALWSVFHGDIKFADAWRYCWLRGSRQGRPYRVHILNGYFLFTAFDARARRP